MLRPWLALGAALLALGALAASAQEQETPAEPLTGALKKIKASGVVTLGYRENSFPFSYLGAGKTPIGYSLELCQEIVEEISDELNDQELQVNYRPVTPETRMQAVAAGEIDLECGSTTNNTGRQKTVAFSPIFFVSGTKLLVRRAERIRSHRDLRGKTVVVTAGTTNEQALRTLIQKQKLDIRLLSAKDHDESFRLFTSGAAAAFATDDVLLYGWIARAHKEREYQVVGEYLSYDPYGIMFRKDDPQFAAVVERTFRRLAESRELEWIYKRWFQRRTPTGENLALPMSAQLREIFQTLGLPEE
ncbi:MAG TPA: amino acid ABC transporter substrate-binding protein [Burkholderiales bacterium]|nr:amino acid ABC transporter substrate-binding protein [Burkholderiales bacterium]